jgi:hypothetical protein
VTQLPLLPEPVAVLPPLPSSTFAPLPPALVDLHLPLVVAMAITHALAEGARVITPDGSTRLWPSNIMADIELILAVGQDRTELKAVGFKMGRYPLLRRATWRRA